MESFDSNIQDRNSKTNDQDVSISHHQAEIIGNIPGGQKTSTSSQAPLHTAPGSELGEVIRTDCPSCQKPYWVSESWIQETQPKFQCSGCTKYFSFTYIEGETSGHVVSFPISARSSEATLQSGASLPSNVGATDLRLKRETELPIPITSPSPRPIPMVNRQLEPVPLRRLVKTQIECPKCGGKTSSQFEECQSCGVILNKVATKSAEGEAGEVVAADSDLPELWDAVVEDYSDEQRHLGFILTCMERNEISFAAHKYARILRAAPEESTAKQMNEKVKAIASVTSSSDFERSRLTAPGFRVWILSWALGAGGGFLMGLGFVIPGFRNLVGVGVAMMSLAIGLRVVLSRPT